MKNAKYTAAFLDLDGEPVLLIAKTSIGSASDFRKMLFSRGSVVLKVWEGDIPNGDILTWYDLEFGRKDASTYND